VRLLPGGDVLARVAHLHDRDVVVVALKMRQKAENSKKKARNGHSECRPRDENLDTYPQELLSARDDVADDERRTERVDDVLVVRVEHEAIFNFTLEADDGLQFEVLFDNLFHWRYFDSIIIAGAEIFNLCGVVANVLMRLLR
jgi:hypothetical protein